MRCELAAKAGAQASWLNGKQHSLGRDKSDVVTAKGRELIASQGSKEPQFRSALDLLSRSTKAELRVV
ncbi:MAG TPA: hypothetical protein VG055_29045 [Planctomycetaceae bacterium]|jgi:hypothetical protein|nr:hypothetical protein [Planctomycetaceae bacterium]